LVVTDIESSTNKFEDWYIGYVNDLKKYGVCVDFSGEGYNRLVWYPAKIETSIENEGRTVPQSYLDMDGKHINYHDITLKEFVERQIEWRIYKRFTINYNKIPYDLTALERQAEVINIVKIVVTAYNFKDFDKLYLADRAITKDRPAVYTGYNAEEVERLNLDRDIIMKVIKDRLAATDEQGPYYLGYFLKDVEKFKTGETKRKPAF
jgi:hypothetical protein